MEGAQQQGTRDAGSPAVAANGSPSSNNTCVAVDISSSRSGVQGSGRNASNNHSSSSSSSGTDYGYGGKNWDAVVDSWKACGVNLPTTNKEALQLLKKHGIEVNQQVAARFAEAAPCSLPAPTPAGQALIRLLPVWGNTPSTYSTTPRTVDGAPYPSKVDISAVMACMEAGAQFTDTTADGVSVLYAAVLLGDRDVLAALFTAAHKLTEDSKLQWLTVLDVLVRQSRGLRVSPHKEHAAQLWALGSTAFSADIPTLLERECVCSGPQSVRGLLQLGADANARDGSTFCYTLLHHLSNPLKLTTAIAPEERIAVGRALLAAGAQLEARDAQGDTPLMTAFRQEEWAPAAWLLESGADTTCTAYDGNNMWALAAGAAEGAGLKLLLERDLIPPGGIRKFAHLLERTSQSGAPWNVWEKRLIVMQKKIKADQRAKAAQARQPPQQGRTPSAPAQENRQHHAAAAAAEAAAAELLAAEEAAAESAADKAAKKAAKKQRQAAAKQQAAAEEAAARKLAAAEEAAARKLAAADEAAAAAAARSKGATRSMTVGARPTAAAATAATALVLTAATSGGSTLVQAMAGNLTTDGVSSSRTDDAALASETARLPQQQQRQQQQQQQHASTASSKKQAPSVLAPGAVSAVQDGLDVTAGVVPAAPAAVPAAAEAAAAVVCEQPDGAPHSQLPGVMGLLMSSLPLREVPAPTTSLSLASGSSSSIKIAAPGHHPGTGASKQPKRAATRHKECVVCYERRPGVVLLPCQHLVLCGPCWEDVAAKRGPECPYCRSAVQSHMVVFR